jgi:hypothetical protein
VLKGAIGRINMEYSEKIYECKRHGKYKKFFVDDMFFPNDCNCPYCYKEQKEIMGIDYVKNKYRVD